jgi:hypothetical protein
MHTLLHLSVKRLQRNRLYLVNVTIKLSNRKFYNSDVFSLLSLKIFPFHAKIINSQIYLLKKTPNLFLQSFRILLAASR